MHYGFVSNFFGFMVEHARESLGFNRPLFEQLVHFVFIALTCISFGVTCISSAQCITSFLKWGTGIIFKLLSKTVSIFFVSSTDFLALIFLLVFLRLLVWVYLHIHRLWSSGMSANASFMLAVISLAFSICASFRIRYVVNMFAGKFFRLFLLCLVFFVDQRLYSFDSFFGVYLSIFSAINVTLSWRFTFRS